MDFLTRLSSIYCILLRDLLLIDIIQLLVDFIDWFFQLFIDFSNWFNIYFSYSIIYWLIIG